MGYSIVRTCHIIYRYRLSTTRKYCWAWSWRTYPNLESFFIEFLHLQGKISSIFFIVKLLVASLKLFLLSLFPYFAHYPKFLAVLISRLFNFSNSDTIMVFLLRICPKLNLPMISTEPHMSLLNSAVTGI